MIRDVATTQTIAREEQSKIRVLVVDDQELFRRGLTMLLSVEDDIDVIGEANDGSEAGTSVRGRSDTGTAVTRSLSRGGASGSGAT